MRIIKWLVVFSLAISLLLPSEVSGVCQYHWLICNSCSGMGIGNCWYNPRQINYYGTLDWYRCTLMWSPCFSGMQCQWTSVEVHSNCDGVGYTYYGYLCCIREY
jgi:hypothetical protein